MAGILHITTRAAWEQGVASGEYRSDSLRTEGFIHCSTKAQIPGVVSRFFAGETDLVVLRIDEAAVAAPIRWEQARDASDTFPHIYGPLNRNAVIDVLTLEQVLSQKTDP
ncbi:MAG TPA: DUF952 domain-containing protein [Planctomycetaceae bacterium]|nr:DUF952 domain-containing protein [Planctomycetaceae bacterium]